MMLCLTVNYRAFTQLSGEWERKADLEAKIETLSSENLALQEEIHYLKHDPNTVEREARKFGLMRQKNRPAEPR
jgi:cell division protein FtsB